MARTLRLSPIRLRVPAAAWGLACIAAGLALLASAQVWRAALGVELVAMAFWLWARSAVDAREQMAR